MSNISGFGGLLGTSNSYSNHNSIWGRNNSSSGSTILSDYAAIKNGSYKKLAKKYYVSDSVMTEKEAKAENKKLGLLQTGADSLSSSLRALGKESLFSKKKISTKDETTGVTSEKEDYDWKAITGAVKSFIDDYNDTIGDAADSNLIGVLRNAMHMTSSVKANSKLLSEVGITIGKENKLELDEDKLKNANISTLKTLFTGTNSFADRLAQKSSAISKAVTDSAKTYAGNGSTLPSSFAKMFETEI